ncbi:MAG: hypothetical protein DDT23_01354 [candidate division WS2 bacterium]|nr:hypothetical protein [Candidatus Lithacetigena glycinireducens]
MGELGDIVMAGFFTGLPILIALTIIYLIGLKKKGGEKNERYKD